MIVASSILFLKQQNAIRKTRANTKHIDPMMIVPVFLSAVASR